MDDTTVDGWDQWRTTHTKWCKKELLIDATDGGCHTRWCTRSCWWMRLTKDNHVTWCAKHLLMKHTDEGVHTRWCTKQLLMDETNEGLPIPDDVHCNCCWTRQMMVSIPDDGRNDCWWVRQRKDYPYQMVPKTLFMDDIDEVIHTRWCNRNCWWMRDEEIHIRWCTKQLLMDETNEELLIPDDV